MATKKSTALDSIDHAARLAKWDGWFDEDAARTKKHREEHEKERAVSRSSDKLRAFAAAFADDTMRRIEEAKAEQRARDEAISKALTEARAMLDDLPLVVDIDETEVVMSEGLPVRRPRKKG